MLCFSNFKFNFFVIIFLDFIMSLKQQAHGRNVVVIGTQWGDEGKGKVVDWLTDCEQPFTPTVSTSVSVTTVVVVMLEIATVRSPMAFKTVD